MESVTRASFWENLENMIGFAIKHLLIQVGNDLLKHTSDATWDNINNMSHERNFLIVRRVILVSRLLFVYNNILSHGVDFYIRTQYDRNYATHNSKMYSCLASPVQYIGRKAAFNLTFKIQSKCRDKRKGVSKRNNKIIVSRWRFLGWLYDPCFFVFVRPRTKQRHWQEFSYHGYAIYLFAHSYV